MVFSFMWRFVIMRACFISLSEMEGKGKRLIIEVQLFVSRLLFVKVFGNAKLTSFSVSNEKGNVKFYS
jgi:hypothetical protein